MLCDKIDPGVTGGGVLNLKLKEFNVNLIYGLSTGFNTIIFGGSLRPDALRTEIYCLTCIMFPSTRRTKHNVTQQAVLKCCDFKQTYHTKVWCINNTQ